MPQPVVEAIEPPHIILPEPSLPPMDREMIYTLALKLITADKGLGYNRAILYLRKNGDMHYLTAESAVGPLGISDLGAAWSVSYSTLEGYLTAADETSPRLRAAVNGTRIKIKDHKSLESAIKGGEPVISKGHDSFNEAMRLIGVELPGQYAFVPLPTPTRSSGAYLPIGVIMVDNSFNGAPLDGKLEELRALSYLVASAIREEMSYDGLYHTIIHNGSTLAGVERQAIITDLYNRISDAVRNSAQAASLSALHLKKLLAEGNGLSPERLDFYIGTITGEMDKLTAFLDELAGQGKAKHNITKQPA